MTPNVEGCKPDAALADICKVMTSKHIHRVVVLDDDGKVAGMVSAIDVVRRMGEELASG